MPLKSVTKTYDQEIRTAESTRVFLEVYRLALDGVNNYVFRSPYVTPDFHVKSVSYSTTSLKRLLICSLHQIRSANFRQRWSSISSVFVRRSRSKVWVSCKENSFPKWMEVLFFRTPTRRHVKMLKAV